MKPCDADFRDDVAQQLRQLGRATGLPWTVISGKDRMVLELRQAGADEAALQIIAAFNDGTAFRPGWRDWLQLRMETGDGSESEELLTLAWLEADVSPERAKIDPSLPLERRGLNADADIREGRYARGDTLRALAKDLRSLAAGSMHRDGTAMVALPVADGGGRAMARTRQAGEAPGIPAVFDAEFEVLGPELSGSAFPARPALRRTPSLDELNERLIAEILEAMQRELAQKDARFAGAGMHTSAKAHFIEAMEWAMLGTAYAIEAKTNQVAVSSFMPGDGASWLYGLVGPVLIGGLASLMQSKAGKAAAFGLMASWALAMAVVTASDKDYLDGAQGWFPKGQAVLAHEKALAAARLERDADEKEVSRLESKPGSNTAALIADARKRWQARELKELGAEERERAVAGLGSAKAALKQAKARVSDEEFALRDALLSDESRNWAWRSLFLIFGVINFAGPFAIAHVLEKWRKDHAAAKQEAQEDHLMREDAKHLRQGRPAQKARAIKLLAAAMTRLEREGIPAELLERLDGTGLAATAADRFDRTANADKFRRRFRLWGPAQN
ncbi:MAG: hypothetical protein ACLPPF_13150 [Rhodomicrobium sp.]